MSETLGLIEFAAAEYARRGWRMPDLHVRIFGWLESTLLERTRVLEVFRGAGKSTILGIYDAWLLHADPGHQILVQGADDALAIDLSRDTLAVMEANPLVSGTVRRPAAVTQWWTVRGYEQNARTPQMRARGILSRITGGRADEVQNDDVEVAKNVESEPARLKLRRKLGEQAHILKPYGRKLFVGTPHTHQSIYDELIKAGAASLVIKLFKHHRRFEDPRQTVFALPAEPGPDGVWVFLGVGPHARLLVEGQHFRRLAGRIELHVPAGSVVDLYTGNAWPERFDRAELEHRRRDCPTLNAWDSQYQLLARPPEQVRLDPQWLNTYAEEPVIGEVNNTRYMKLGDARIVSATLRLDPASGKPRSDVSALCLVLQDEVGNVFWHRAIALYGELAETDDAGTIKGGQVDQVCDVIRQFELTRVDVETNGIGGHVPAILRAAIKRRGLPCAVRECIATGNKNQRILAALEPPLRSGYLWAHDSVVAVVDSQMRDWNPAVREQPDDFLDAAAGAIAAEPVRIGTRVTTRAERQAWGWRPNGGTHEAELEFGGRIQRSDE